MEARSWVAVRVSPDPEELMEKEAKIVSVPGVTRSHWASIVSVQPEAFPTVDALSKKVLVSPLPKTLISTPHVIVLAGDVSLMLILIGNISLKRTRVVPVS